MYIHPEHSVKKQNRMERRMRGNGRCVRQKRFNGDDGVCEADGEDLISKLPDDILVTILSRLTMKEAARTSVLSWRWRALWTFSSGSLSFDTQLKAFPLKSKKRRRRLSGEGRLSIVSWWSKVMESHKGPRITELSVFASSEFTESECDVSRCISFAMKKKVQKLVLASPLQCQFPSPSSLGLSSFNFLKSLTLITADVTEEEIECFLSNCPDLECLSLQLFRCLGALTTISSPSLKSLKMLQLCNHTNVKVYAPKLLMFDYRGCPVSYEFENVPNLIDVSLGWVGCDSSLFEELSNILSRVERLSLAVFLYGGVTCARIPELRNLKEVKLNLSLKDDSNVVMFCASLMKASPSLCKCELRLSWSRFPKAEVMGMQEAENHLHPCLKVVKLSGFTGRKSDIELANYVVENALLLEELTIAYDREKPKVWEFGEFQEEIDWDSRLEAKMSPGAKLVII